MPKQPREGQAYRLPKSAAPADATHVAIQKQHRFRYFCRFDPTDKHPQEGVPDDEVEGTFWIVKCHLYGSCYNGASLWQGGFDFIPLDEYEREDTADPVVPVTPKGRDLGLSEDPPEDLPVIVANIGEGMIVWSREGRTHRVRYGLQVREYTQDSDDPTFAQLAASEEFGHCVRHYAECEGLLDD